MNIELIKLTMFITGVGAIAYTVGRIFYTIIKVRVTTLHLVTAPILGLLLLATQLWLYGLVGLPWDRWILLLPWFGLGILLRSTLFRSLVHEKRLMTKSWRKITSLDIMGRTLLVVGIIICAAFFISLLVEPFITSDILAIWGYKAKNFFHYSSVYINPALNETINSARFYHIDYPPLLPLTADVFYVFRGHVDESLFKGMQIIFLVCGAGALFAYTRSIFSSKDKSLAVLFAFLFIAVPQFIPLLFQLKYMGYADYPLAVVMMISTIFVLRSINSPPNSNWLLALLFASFAAVMKNEGLAFLGIILLVLSVLFASHYTTWSNHNKRRTLVWYASLVGLVLLPNIIWIIYKQINHIQVDFKFSNLSESGMNLFSRIDHIGSLIWLYVRTNPIFHWQIAALVIGFVAALWSRSKTAIVLLIIICLQLGSYVFSFIFSPYDLEFHILASIDRLLTQVLPQIILLLAVSLAANTKVRDQSN